MATEIRTSADTSGPPPVRRARTPAWPRRVAEGIELDRRLVWIAMGAVAVALAAVVLSLLLSDGATSGSAGEHDAITRELLLPHIPEEMRDSCRTAPVPDVAVFVRSVSCENGLGGRARYSRAFNGDALRQYFLSRLELIVNVPFPTDERCGSSELASGEWVRIDAIGHREERSKAAQGRVACFVEGDRASLIWTDTPTKIFASTSAPADAREDLNAWWTTDAGPRTGAAPEGRELEPFPDALERELLLDHLPGAVRNCARAPTPDPQIFLRTVACDQPGGAGRVSYSYARDGSGLRRYFALRGTAAGLTLAERSDCASDGTGVGSSGRTGAAKHETTVAAAGSQLCFKRDGNATIEWFDVAQVTYASASRPEASASELYEWWSTDAGPVAHGHEDGDAS